MRQVGKMSKAIDSFKKAEILDPASPVALKYLRELIGEETIKDPKANQV